MLSVHILSNFGKNGKSWFFKIFFCILWWFSVCNVSKIIISPFTDQQRNYHEDLGESQSHQCHWLIQIHNPCTYNSILCIHVCFLVTDITEIIWSHPDVPQSLCSPISMFPGPMFPGPMFPSIYVPQSLCSPFYVPRSLCSPVLCSPVPMFPNPYVPHYLCFPIPMFPGTFFFFLGGGGGMRSVGTIC